MDTMDTMDMGSMAMTFSSLGSYNVTILWDFWNVTTQWEYLLSCLAIVGLCMLYHFVRSIESKLASDLHAIKDRIEAEGGLRSAAISSPLLQPKTRACNNYARLKFAVISALGYCIALLLMLVAMTFNSGLFITIILGWGLGQYVFYVSGAPTTYHCH